jgi:hypothetical protein
MGFSCIYSTWVAILILFLFLLSFFELGRTDWPADRYFIDRLTRLAVSFFLLLGGLRCAVYRTVVPLSSLSHSFSNSSGTSEMIHRVTTHETRFIPTF